jgi:hypothetical protein
MSERSAWGVSMADPEQKRQCPTCRHLLDADAFYANCAECKACKRRRSQRNRALQARKLAAFERFVDALVDLADRAPELPPERTTSLTSTAPMAAIFPVTQSTRRGAQNTAPGPGIQSRP